MNTILYIGDFKFSKMNAECQLVLGNAFVMRDLGYEVVLIGNDVRLEEYSSLKNTRESHYGFEVYNIPTTKGLKDVVTMFDRQRELEALFENREIKGVVCYGTPTFSGALFLIRHWCRRNGYAFIVNCVDIPCLAHGSLLQRTIRKIDRTARYYLYRRADGLIAVSTYIARYFAGKSLQTVIVPPIRDMSQFPSVASERKCGVRLVYGGCPFPTDGRKVLPEAYKDRLDLAIELVASVLEQRQDVFFDIYGLDEEQYLRVVPAQKELLNKNSENIVFHGHISNDECMEKFSEADFLILLRNDVEMCKAGFSTKIVDAVSCGTPVITTLVGDLERYLTDGKQMFIVDIDNLGQAKAQFKEIICKEEEEIFRLKRECLDSRIFDYEKYKEILKEFFEKLHI